VGLGAALASTERQRFLQEVADAGVGFRSGGSAAPGVAHFAAAAAALPAAVEAAFASVRSCAFDLDVTIAPDAAAKGTVTVAGGPKTFGDPNGWRLVDGDTIEFVGAACAAIQGGPAEVRVAFPCGTAGVATKLP
jgi:hypothetical protein